MDWLKIFGGQQALVFIVPGIMTQVGMSLKNKDDNATGNDDVLGNVLIAMAPVIPAALTGNDKLITKALDAVYDTIGGYRGFPPRQK
jgi:hypothetical protein